MLRYAITDRTLFGLDEHRRRSALIRQTARLVHSGVEFVQLREKDLPAGDLAALAREMLRTLQMAAPDASARPNLLINGRADVAIASGADGVHLTSAPGELTPAQVDELYLQCGLPAPTISISCHSVEEIAALRATQDGPQRAPDLILFGPVFEKRVHGERVMQGTGLDRLVDACRAAGPIPVLALGGITESTTLAVLRAGAAGVAGIRLFASAELPAESTH